MRSTATFVAAALAVFLAEPTAAVLPAKCLKPAGTAVPTENIDAGLVTFGTEWNCGLVSAPNNQVRTVTMNVDKTSLTTPTGANAVMQVVFWNVAGSYNDESWKNDNWNTEQLFFVIPPGTQLDAINRPWALANALRPSVPNSWSVQSGSATGTDYVTVGASVTAPELCEGTYTAIISAKGNNGVNTLNKEATTGVLWRIVDATYTGASSLNGLSASSSLVNEFFPRTGSDFGTTAYEVTGNDWADYRYMLKSFQITVTGPRWIIAPVDPADTSNVRNTVSVSIASADGGQWGTATPFIKTTPGSETATYTTTYNLSDTTSGTPLGAQFSYTPGATVTGGQVDLTLASTNAAPLINTAGQYQWEQIGPFVDLTVQITDATEYPTLSSADIMLLPNGTFEEQSTVYMLKTSDPLVYQMGASVSGVTAALRFAAPSVVPAQDSHIATTYLLANPGTAQTVAAAGFGSAIPVVPSHMSSFFTAVAAPGSGSATSANLPVQWSGSSGLARPYIGFVQFTGSSCPGTTGNTNAHLLYSARVSANLPTALVECANNYDCAGPPGNHPSQDRAKFSANGDANRFSTCYLHYDVTGFGESKPSTRCMECAPLPSTNSGNDLECNQGQFCWTDYGVCASGGSDYVCDTEANSWIGTCRNKSTEILGKKCRTIETARVNNVGPTGIPADGTGTSTPNSLGATFRDLRALNGYAPGAGFCGEVRYLNNTGVGAIAVGSTTPQFRLNGTVRATLWTGSCVGGMCMECTPGSFPSDSSVSTSGKTCVNGYLVTPITVDNTVRTLVFNATGSAAAVTASFAVLLFLVALCSMQNSGNRHRELYGENPMTVVQVLKAVTYEWMCCLKGESDRARAARYVGKPAAGVSVATPPAGATSVTPLTGHVATGATVNPLDGKQAQDWGART